MGAPVGPVSLGLLLALAWLGGTAWQLQQAALWRVLPLLALAAVALGLAALAWRHRRAWPGALTLALAVAALAFVVTSGRAAWRLADALPPTLEGQDLVVTGVISDLPRVSLIGTRFNLDVESVERLGAPVTVPRRLSLGWYRGVDDGALLAGPVADLRAGQRWRCWSSARWGPRRRPGAAAAPGRERWCWRWRRPRWPSLPPAAAPPGSWPTPCRRRWRARTWS